MFRTSYLSLRGLPLCLLCTLSGAVMAVDIDQVPAMVASVAEERLLSLEAVRNTWPEVVVESDDGTTTARLSEYQDEEDEGHGDHWEWRWFRPAPDSALSPLSIAHESAWGTVYYRINNGRIGQVIIRPREEQGEQKEQQKEQEAEKAVEEKAIWAFTGTDGKISAFSVVNGALLGPARRWNSDGVLIESVDIDEPVVFKINAGVWSDPETVKKIDELGESQGDEHSDKESAAD